MRRSSHGGEDLVKLPPLYLDPVTQPPVECYQLMRWLVGTIRRMFTEISRNRLRRTKSIDVLDNAGPPAAVKPASHSTQARLIKGKANSKASTTDGSWYCWRVPASSVSSFIIDSYIWQWKMSLNSSALLNDCRRRLYIQKDIVMMHLIIFAQCNIPRDIITNSVQPLSTSLSNIS